MKKLFTLNKELEIIKYYLAGNSLIKCSNKYKCSNTAISKLLLRHNIKRRTRFEAKFKYLLNHNYFDIIDTKDKAYFLGLMITDGCINGKYISIKLAKQDKYILEKFKEYIKYTGNLYINNRSKENINHQDQYVLSLTSKNMTLSLSKLGIVPRKTHITDFPCCIPEYLTHHFIRGCFDGDGTVYINKNWLVFSITGNNLLISKIQKILIEKCSLNKIKLLKNGKSPINICKLTYGGNTQVKRIYEYLYKDCGDLYLTRKKEKYETI